MFRLMQPGDLPALKQLFADCFGDSPDFAEIALQSFAGPDNVFLAEREGVPVSMLCAVPVTHKGRKGAYLYGVCTHPDCRGKGLAAGLIEEAARQLALRGTEFLVLIPQEPSLFAWYQQQGFQKAFALRTVQRPIKRNLWAQAEFDTITAKHLCELRSKFCPDSIALPPAQMAVVLSCMYKEGVTIVSNKGGYGLYFRKGETLVFPELQAENDRAADLLLQAAREKEVVVENARVTVGAEQLLFAGEGDCRDYGMIRFLAKPVDVSETFMRLMLDE